MEEQGLLPIFTIGHSLLSAERFVALLNAHSVEVLLDVRSSPYSARAPHFNGSVMRSWLADQAIVYSFAGRSLGGRPSDPSLYHGRQANYPLMAAVPAFVSGVRRIAITCRRSRIALMCSEADPLECHRFLLISRVLAQKGLSVHHILKTGLLESQAQAEQRLLAVAGLAQAGLFDATSSDALASAYAKQASKFAYFMHGDAESLASGESH